MEYALKEFNNNDGKALEVLTFTGNKRPDFIIQWNNSDEWFSDFTIFEITSWKTDADHTPNEWEEYISGSIKWDGCSHITFGGNRGGYQHLCGKSYFDKHCKILQAIWDICSKRIKAFDHETAT